MFGQSSTYVGSNKLSAHVLFEIKECERLHVTVGSQQVIKEALKRRRSEFEYLNYELAKKLDEQDRLAMPTDLVQHLDEARQAATDFHDRQRFGAAVERLWSATERAQQHLMTVRATVRREAEEIRGSKAAREDLYVTALMFVEHALTQLQRDELHLALENCRMAKTILLGHGGSTEPLASRTPPFQPCGPCDFSLPTVLAFLKDSTGPHVPKALSEKAARWNLLEMWHQQYPQESKNRVPLLATLQSYQIAAKSGDTRPWMEFLQSFMRCLGWSEMIMAEPKNLGGTSHYLELPRGISCRGSFLAQQKDPLIAVFWRNPHLNQPKNLQEALKGVGLQDRLGVVIVTGVLPSTLQRTLAKACPKLALLDERRILAILAGRNWEERVQRLANAMSVQLPPAVANPFKSAGAVNTGMFFGRTRHKDELLNQGPSIVYAGRRLGKTSLLREVERAFEERRRGQNVAVYVEATAHSSQPAAVLGGIMTALSEPEYGKRWRNDPKLLAAQGGFAAYLHKDRPEKFRDDMLSLCRGFPDHNFLVIIDEADLFCERLAEPQSGIWERDIGWMLRGIVEQSKGRIDFLFAGYQQVYRAAVKLNGPFYNFRKGHSTPLVLEVMAQDEARELVELPLGISGMTFGGRCPTY